MGGVTDSFALQTLNGLSLGAGCSAAGCGSTVGVCRPPMLPYRLQTIEHAGVTRRLAGQKSIRSWVVWSGHSLARRTVIATREREGTDTDRRAAIGWGGGLKVGAFSLCGRGSIRYTQRHTCCRKASQATGIASQFHLSDSFLSHKFRIPHVHGL